MHNQSTPNNRPKGAKQRECCSLAYHSSGLQVIKKGRNKGKNKGGKKLGLFFCNFKVSDQSFWGLVDLSLFLRPVPLGPQR